jgi:hypothetical protein
VSDRPTVAASLPSLSEQDETRWHDAGDLCRTETMSGWTVVADALDWHGGDAQITESTARRIADCAAAVLPPYNEVCSKFVPGAGSMPIADS